MDGGLGHREGILGTKSSERGHTPLKEVRVRMATMCHHCLGQCHLSLLPLSNYQ